MKASSLVLTLFALLLGACDDGAGSFSRTATYRQMRYVHAEGPDAILRESVFSLVRGKTREDAIELLRSDGATCTSQVCMWRYTEKENAFNTFGISTRPNIPYRTWEKTNVVKILSEKVVEITDIYADHSSERIK